MYGKMSKPIGYIRQQTINCDYIVCTKHADIESFSVRELKTPVIDTLIQKINTLEETVRDLQDRIATTYTRGVTVSSTLHFDDIDLNAPSFNLKIFESELKDRIAYESGVESMYVTIVSVTATGSASVRMEVKYKESSDTVQNQKLTESKNAYMATLTDPLLLQNALISLGSVQLEPGSLTEEDISSIPARLYNIERFLHSDEIDFEKSKSLRINNYKLEINGTNMNIRRYDPEEGSFVGGTVVID